MSHVVYVTLPIHHIAKVTETNHDKLDSNSPMHGLVSNTHKANGTKRPKRQQLASVCLSIVRLAPKVPKQNVGCQPQTLEGEEGGRV